eukprot:976363-Amphidinium_carterae.1
MLTPGANARDVYTDGDYIRLCYGGLATDYAAVHDNKPLLGVCPRSCGCSPVTNISQDYFTSAYELYNKLLEQDLHCPGACGADDMA